MLYKVAVIGAGQLGSRHLQGLKTASSPMEIWVVDSNSESLNVASERYDEVSAVSEKRVHFINELYDLPEDLDFVVVATGSLPRASIVTSLLRHSNVRNLILEKVLFPRLKEYDDIEVLLEKKDVNCWVNCTRRMFGCYQKIAGFLHKNEKLEMWHGGKSWGLCCNSIHMIDIFLRLLDEVDYKLDTSELIPRIFPSKRSGYIEFEGKLTITTLRGDRLVLVSREDYEGASSIEITSGDNKISINEAERTFVHNGKKRFFLSPFQSQLTGTVADLVLKTECCSLTDYKKSAQYHRTFIQALLDFYNQVSGSKTDCLPIT